MTSGPHPAAALRHTRAAAPTRPDDGTALARLQSLSPADVDAIMAVEVTAYSHPWSRGNFIDSLHAGHWARWVRGDDGRVLAYAVAMPGVEEMHLLNLTTAPACQRLGWARWLLRQLCLDAAIQGARSLWLEVRISNAPALALYAKAGFQRVGLRRGYYPSTNSLREDAVVMRLELATLGTQDAVD